MNRETTPEIQRGMKIRREVLGDEYVDKATSDNRDFFREFQEIITGKCWGAAWECLLRRTGCGGLFSLSS